MVNFLFQQYSLHFHYQNFKFNHFKTNNHRYVDLILKFLNPFSTTLYCKTVKMLRIFNKKLSKYQQAELASIIEIDKLSKPIGRQDQFLSCLGGISVLKFEKNGKVIKQKISSAKEKVIDKVIENLYLIPSFITRKTDSDLRNLKNGLLTKNIFIIKEFFILITTLGKNMKLIKLCKLLNLI